MEQNITIDIINLLHNSGNLKLKCFYRSFKDLTEKWLKYYNIKGYCNYSYNKTGKLCLTKIDKNGFYCKNHNKLIWEKEVKLINKLTSDIFYEYKNIQKPLGISRSINIVENDIIYEIEKVPSLIITENKNKETEPSCPSYDEIYPPKKPDECGKTIINNIKNQKPLSYNKLIKIDYQKIFNELQFYKSLDGINHKDKLYLCNKELVTQYKDIEEFIDKYKFLRPIKVTDGNKVLSENDIMDKSDYINFLLNLRLNNYPNFRGKDIQEYSKKILEFQFRSYSYINFNKPYLSNNMIKIINKFISQIPK